MYVLNTIDNKKNTWLAQYMLKQRRSEGKQLKLRKTLALQEKERAEAGKTQEKVVKQELNLARSQS